MAVMEMFSEYKSVIFHLRTFVCYVYFQHRMTKHMS